MRNKGINFPKVPQWIRVKLEFEYGSFDYMVLLLTTKRWSTPGFIQNALTPTLWVYIAANSSIVPTSNVSFENSKHTINCEPL